MYTSINKKSWFRLLYRQFISNVILLNTVAVYSKTFKEKTFITFMVFTHLEFFPRIIALSTGNISLQACYCESFPRVIIFISKRESFPSQKFCSIWYATNNILCIIWSLVTM